MRLSHLLLAAAFAAAPLAHAQSDMKHEHGTAQKAQTHQAVGVVKSVNTEKGSVTIAHEPVPSLKWPGMTMSFKARDKKMLQPLKPGAKIEFDFEQRGKDYVITRIK